MRHRIPRGSQLLLVDHLHAVVEVLGEDASVVAEGVGPAITQLRNVRRVGADGDHGIGKRHEIAPHNRRALMGRRGEDIPMNAR